MRKESTERERERERERVDELGGREGEWMSGGGRGGVDLYSQALKGRIVSHPPRAPPRRRRRQKTLHSVRQSGLYHGEVS